MDKKQQLSRAQEKAKAYMEEHNIDKTIGEMLNSLVHSRDPSPIIFMVSIFAINFLFRILFRSSTFQTLWQSKSLMSMASKSLVLFLKEYPLLLTPSLGQSVTLSWKNILHARFGQTWRRKLRLEEEIFRSASRVEFKTLIVKSGWWLQMTKLIKLSVTFLDLLSKTFTRVLTLGTLTNTRILRSTCLTTKSKPWKPVFVKLKTIK